MEAVTIVGFVIVVLSILILTALVIWNLRIIEKIYRSRITSFREIIRHTKIVKRRRK